MGAIADAFVAFGRPLIDQTDGSLEQLNEAFTIVQLCYNLALTPKDRRDEMLREMQLALGMDNETFEAFRSSTVLPMIRRHEEMFRRMHMEVPPSPIQSSPRPRPRMVEYPSMAVPAAKPPATNRYAPCPCNSGKKYKFCCGMKRR